MNVMKYRANITLFYRKESILLSNNKRIEGSRTKVLDEIACIMRDEDFENIQVTIKRVGGIK